MRKIALFLSIFLMAVSTALAHSIVHAGESPAPRKEISELLDKVKDVSKLESSPGDFAGAFSVMLDYTLGVVIATEPVKKEGTEEVAIKALSELATDRKDSRNKSDPFICWGIVVALKQFPEKANLFCRS